MVFLIYCWTSPEKQLPGQVPKFNKLQLSEKQSPAILTGETVRYGLILSRLTQLLGSFVTHHVTVSRSPAHHFAGTRDLDAFRDRFSGLEHGSID